MSNEWQAIETAPVPTKDWDSSDMILVWNGHQALPCIIERYKPVTVFYDYSSCDRDGEYGYVSPPPTHWMPLPSGPVQ